MCGIALSCHSDGQQASEKIIRRMVKSIAHRGPDALTHIVRGATALGHARLSIVDIKEGNQPMLSDDGRFALVFNGEIYNFKALRKELEIKGAVFKTHSDTEVLLRLFEQDGIDCVPKLRGMFAFAIHDNKKDCLYLARDRLGIKPLFYHWDDKTLLAGSEAKALFASGELTAKLDVNAIRSYFRYQFAINPQTIFEGVNELPPGHTLCLQQGGVPELDQYWDLQFPVDGEYESLDEDYWLSRFEEALDDAASSHMIGDVPIGAYLSGGIDSAATTYLLNRHVAKDKGSRVQSYTIKFSNAVNDESGLAANIAQHLGVPNETILLDDEREAGFLSEFKQCLYHLEQPQRLAVDVPHFMLSGLVHSKGQKVVFTGDGADEILGGYDCYRQDAMRIWGNQQKNTRVRRRYYLNEYRKDFADEHVRLLFDLHKPKRQRSVIRKFGCYPAWNDFWHILDDVCAPLFDEALDAQDDHVMDTAAEAMRRRINGLHPLNQSLYIETKTRLPGWILWKSDRLSMAHSVEARVPFMDHPLVELAAIIPPGLKLNGMDEKYILRKSMASHLPEHPNYFKKRAFYTPIREWFFTSKKQTELTTYLSEDALLKTGYFQPKTVAAYLDKISNLGQPETMDQYYTIMKLEWVLQMVLSVQILHHLFVDQEADCFHLTS